MIFLACSTTKTGKKKGEVDRKEIENEELLLLRRPSR